MTVCNSYQLASGKYLSTLYTQTFWTTLGSQTRHNLEHPNLRHLTQTTQRRIYPCTCHLSPNALSHPRKLHKTLRDVTCAVHAPPRATRRAQSSDIETSTPSPPLHSYQGDLPVSHNLSHSLSATIINVIMQPAKQPQAPTSAQADQPAGTQPATGASSPRPPVEPDTPMVSPRPTFHAPRPVQAAPLWSELLTAQVHAELRDPAAVDAAAEKAAAAAAAARAALSQLPGPSPRKPAPVKPKAKLDPSKAAQIAAKKAAHLQALADRQAALEREGARLAELAAAALVGSPQESVPARERSRSPPPTSLPSFIPLHPGAASSAASPTVRQRGPTPSPSPSPSPSPPAAPSPSPQRATSPPDSQPAISPGAQARKARAEAHAAAAPLTRAAKAAQAEAERLATAAEVAAAAAQLAPSRSPSPAVS